MDQLIYNAEFIEYVYSHKCDEESWQAYLEKEVYTLDGGYKEPIEVHDYRVFGDYNNRFWEHTMEQVDTDLEQAVLAYKDFDVYELWNDNNYDRWNPYWYLGVDVKPERDRAWRRAQRERYINKRLPVISHWGFCADADEYEYVVSALEKLNFIPKFDGMIDPQFVRNFENATGISGREMANVFRVYHKKWIDEKFVNLMYEWKRGDFKIGHYKEVEEEYQYLYDIVYKDGEFKYIYKTGTRTKTIWVNETDLEKVEKRIWSFARSYGITSQWRISVVQGAATGKLAKHQYQMGNGRRKRWGDSERSKSLAKVAKHEIEESVLDFLDIQRYGSDNDEYEWDYQDIYDDYADGNDWNMHTHLYSDPYDIDIDLSLLLMHFNREAM